MPRQLIFYPGDALCGGRNIADMLCVLGRLNHAAQQDPAMIAVDGNGVVVGNTVTGKGALDLGDQQSVVRLFRRGVVMMIPRNIYAVVLAGRGVRGIGRTRIGAYIDGKQSAANQ